ncbi:hypothetical protein MNBD_BACTEROID05-849 [hydrothermal vent metagenome]|uniref:DUF488 domain-containing protein n=1 Tax=hydrothermal vent metagenome TaxID=652676 RepID=A0A3B0U4M9_9ZZZZ
MNKNKLICYTIGHSNHSVNTFISLLTQHKITCLVDVRSAPYSKFASQFNKEPLAKELEKSKILYKYMGIILGGRCNNPDLQFEDGRVNYEALSQTVSFQEGLEKLIRNIQKDFKIALMCAEKDPYTCHRFLLLSKNLKNKNVNIMHILENGELLPNKEVENQLLKDYKKEFISGQKDFFNNQISNKTNVLENAYELHNKTIAYKSNI